MVSNTFPKHQFECVLGTNMERAQTLTCPFSDSFLHTFIPPLGLITVVISSVAKYHLLPVTMYSSVDFASTVLETFLSVDFFNSQFVGFFCSNAFVVPHLQSYH